MWQFVLPHGAKRLAALSCVQRMNTCMHLVNKLPLKCLCFVTTSFHLHRVINLLLQDFSLNVYLQSVLSRLPIAFKH